MNNDKLIELYKEAEFFIHGNKVYVGSYQNHIEITEKLNKFAHLILAQQYENNLNMVVPVKLSDDELHKLITQHYPKCLRGKKNKFEVTDWWRFGIAIQEAMLSASPTPPINNEINKLKDELFLEIKNLKIELNHRIDRIESNRNNIYSQPNN